MTATTRRTDPPLVTVDEFLAMPGDGTGRIFELFEGVVKAQDSASDGHGTIQANLIREIGVHLKAKRPECRVVAAPGVQPHLRANWNHRVPEIAVTCTSHHLHVHKTPNPILIIEVLSPSNAADTWSNVALFATLPSVVEIVVVESEKVGVHVLRRGPDGAWPPNPTLIEPTPAAAGPDVHLASVDLELALRDIYAWTELAPR